MLYKKQKYRCPECGKEYCNDIIMTKEEFESGFWDVLLCDKCYLIKSKKYYR